MALGLLEPTGSVFLCIFDVYVKVNEDSLSLTLRWSGDIGWMGASSCAQGPSIGRSVGLTFEALKATFLRSKNDFLVRHMYFRVYFPQQRPIHTQKKCWSQVEGSLRALKGHSFTRRWRLCCSHLQPIFLERLPGIFDPGSITFVW